MFFSVLVFKFSPNDIQRKRDVFFLIVWDCGDFPKFISHVFDEKVGIISIQIMHKNRGKFRYLCLQVADFMSSSAKSSSQVAMIGDFCVFNFFPAKPANIRFSYASFFPFFPKNSFRVFFSAWVLEFHSKSISPVQPISPEIFCRHHLLFFRGKTQGRNLPQLGKQEESKSCKEYDVEFVLFFPRFLFPFFSKCIQNQRK